MVNVNPLAPSLPGPGPLYTTLTTLWKSASLPNPPSYLTTWQHGVTPLSTNKAVVATILTYLAVIFGGRELMRSRTAFKATALFQFHNLILTSGSLVLLLLMLEEIVPMYFKHGFFFAICNAKAYTPRLVSYYMVNYYIKYYELLDTVFLVLKKKPLAFLHVFHHAATAILCFTQLEGTTSVQWVVITLNLLVHVIMYYYYYATAGGAKIWWKKYLTSLQITQFVIDLFIVYFASTLLFSHRLRHAPSPLQYIASVVHLPNVLPNVVSTALGIIPDSIKGSWSWGVNQTQVLPFPTSTYNHFVATHMPSMPCVGDCVGSEGAALFGCGLLTSYLFLFIAFYRNTYKKSGAKAKAAKAAAAGIANGSGPSTANVRGSAKSKVIKTDSNGTVVITELAA